MTETSKRAREEEEQEVQAANKKAAVQEEEKDNEDVDDVDSDGDDSDIGPMLPPADADVSTLTTARRKKPVRVLKHEKTFLANLPEADMYERSLMHRETVNFVHVTKNTDFLITTSIDGHVKFWKKSEEGIEFVKHFRAHLGAVVATAVSLDGTLLATAGADKGVKVFDIVNFDMINIIKLDCLPNTLCWVYKPGQAEFLLACSDKETPNIHVYNGKGDTTEPLMTIKSLHNQPVHLIKYNEPANVVVSVDEGGMVEYWVPELDSGSSDAGESGGAGKGFLVPAPQSCPHISWEFKSDTDLYEFKKAKTAPTSLEFSPDFTKFVTFGFGDRIVRVFHFTSGKLMRKFDESLPIISEMQQAGTAVHKLDDMEFGRRFAVERDIEAAKGGGQSATVNAIFDESGNFIIYPTLLGIKVLNIHTNKVVRLVGKMENQRFMNISLYQGAPKKKNVITMAMAASDNPIYKESEKRDPTLFCTAYKRNRFYLFTQRDASLDTSLSGRDIFNEKPSKEEQTLAMAQTHLKQALGSVAILHTTLGDIHLRLFPEYAPKAVENFVGLAKKGYYDNVIFHRVIKGFMLQTGDPEGDGTGGESLWGEDFEDEFHKAVKHDRPYTLSMANCGPGTNASQFFITTVPTPWLDNKHTVFGRATGGMDVIVRIENLKTNKQDKPYDEVKILSVEVR